MAAGRLHSHPGGDPNAAAGTIRRMAARGS
jgi:hypothetical protein